MSLLIRPRKINRDSVGRLMFSLGYYVLRARLHTLTQTYTYTITVIIIAIYFPGHIYILSQEHICTASKEQRSGRWKDGGG